MHHARIPSAPPIHLASRGSLALLLLALGGTACPESGSVGDDDDSGTTSGFSDASRLSLPTHGATDAEIADLNADGLPDLVFANSMEGGLLETDFEVDSVIYWGSLQGLGETNTTSLPTLSAAEVEAADLDLDGDLDLVFANHYDANGDPEANSCIYWNDGGFDATNRTELPTITAAGLAVGWLP